MKVFLKAGTAFLCLILLATLLSACGQSFEKVLSTEKWKVYSGGDEVTYEFNEDGTGQYSYGGYEPRKVEWEISEDKLLLTHLPSGGTTEFIISQNNGVYKLKREEDPLYSNEYILTRQKDFEKLYDFEDRLISKAEFDVFLIYNSNFSRGNYVEVFVTGIENFGDIYTVSGKAQYKDEETYKTYTGTFEIQYKYNGEEIIEIDNYFSRPN